MGDFAQTEASYPAGPIRGRGRVSFHRSAGSAMETLGLWRKPGWIQDIRTFVLHSDGFYHRVGMSEELATCDFCGYPVTYERLNVQPVAGRIYHDKCAQQQPFSRQCACGDVFYGVLMDQDTINDKVKDRKSHVYRAWHGL